MPRIVFMGTPEFAVPALQSLLNSNYEIPLVVSQPDRKKGRGHKVQFPPVKEIAIQNNIEVYQPEKIRNEDAITKLRAAEADFFVVIAYGKILPEDILDIPTKACINVHASLLPQWRGAAPIQFSLLNGDETTGVCTMLMDKGMDTGDLLLTEKTKIDAEENYGSLSDRLAKMGGELIVKTIETFDQITPQKQDHEKATYTRLLKKEDRIINWQLDADEVYCKFRALMPAPGVVTEFRNKRLLLKSIKPVEEQGLKMQTNPGEIIELRDKSFDVACGSGKIRIFSCQPESKKEVSATEFINGYQLKTGEFLGEKN